MFTFLYLLGDTQLSADCLLYFYSFYACRLKRFFATVTDVTHNVRSRSVTFKSSLEPREDDSKMFESREYYIYMQIYNIFLQDWIKDFAKIVVCESSLRRYR